MGAKPDDHTELLNRTLRWCNDGLVFAANLRHAGEVIDELGLSKSKPVTSLATVDCATRCHDDELKSRGEEEKRLYQRIVAKLNYHSPRYQFERFREVLELIFRFQFVFRRRGFFLNDLNFWCVQSSTPFNEIVHVLVLWLVYAHTIPFRMLWRP